jgi:hypothetical protein
LGEECIYYPPIAVYARETSSGPRLLKAGLKDQFCLFSFFAQGAVLSATSAGIYLHFNDGRLSPIHGGEQAGYMVGANCGVRICFLLARFGSFHSNGAMWRTAPDAGKLAYRFPQDKHIEPICVMLVCLSISLSRVEPAAEITGPSHSLQVDADR